MRTVAEQVDHVLGVLRPLPPLEVGLLDAHGCVLAEDVVATGALPATDLAGLSGYAVRAADVATVPASLHVTGDVARGVAGSLRVQPGLCVRVETGAVLPDGADAVVPTEWTDGGVAEVRVVRAPGPGGFVRRAGEDVAPGAVLAAAGSHLAARQLALVAASGRARVTVHPRPRVVVVSAGRELVEPGEPAGPGRVSDANSLALTAASIEAGAIAYRVGIVDDDPRRLSDTLEDQLVRADVLLVAGGSRPAITAVLARLGGVDAAELASEPAMPQSFGTVGPDRTPVFGLPSDAVAAMLSFEVLVRPALRRMLGESQVHRPRVTARCLTAVRSPVGLRSFVSAHLDVTDGAYVVAPTEVPGSHLVSGLARANALVVVPEGVHEVAAGAAVEVMVLERRAH